MVKMSYSLRGEFSGLTQLGRSGSCWLSGTENGEVVTVDAQGSAQVKEASDEACRGNMHVTSDGDKCLMVLGESVTVRELPDFKGVVEESIGRRTLDINHAEFSKSGNKV